MSQTPRQDDPFGAFESDRTIIKPSAGRKVPPAAAPTADPLAPVAPEPAAAAPVDLTELPSVSGWNPLLQAAAPLLATAPRLRAMTQLADPGAMRASLMQAVQRFEHAARAAGLPNEQVVAARYILCTFIDESASSTPWGGSGAWGAQSLLVTFHNEVFGGEKVFVLLARLAENVAANRNLLELLHVVLALGFEGRYRVLDNGRAQLEAVRERLAQMLRADAGATPDKALSPHWQGVRAPATRLRDGIPVWAVAALALLPLLLLFAVLRFALSDLAAPTYSALAALDIARPPAPAAPVPAPQPRLAALLAADIQAGTLEVRDYADRSVVVLRGDGFFAPASAEIDDRARPLLGRVAAALQQLPGQVLVTGHTDDQPIRSLRYPSNWHLSQARADSVKALLAGTLKAERLRAEGHADTEPVDDNRTPAGRSRNRRVEVTLAVTPNR